MVPSHILIIEDIPDNAALLKTQISALWPDTHTTYHIAESLSEAKKKSAEIDPSLVVLDLNLPDSVGLDTLDAVIQILSATVPIIVISGYLSRLEGFRSLHRGAESFILKGEDWTAQKICEKVGAAWGRTQGRECRTKKKQAASFVQSKSSIPAKNDIKKQWKNICALCVLGSLAVLLLFSVRIQATNYIWGYRLSGIYYFVGCSQYPVSPVDTKRWEMFLTKEDAEKSGYRMAKNCGKRVL